jgi:hypothetical protein
VFDAGVFHVRATQTKRECCEEGSSVRVKFEVCLKDARALAGDVLVRESVIRGSGRARRGGSQAESSNRHPEDNASQ